MHLLQARIFGPLFLPIYLVNYVVNFTLQGLWTITIGALLWKLGIRETPFTSVLRLIQWCRASSAGSTTRPSSNFGPIPPATRDRRSTMGAWQRDLFLILFVPDHRLPKLDLVAVRVHDPCKFSVFVRFRPRYDLDAVLL